MALYLGSEKLGVTIPCSVGAPFATGTVTSDSDGVIRFPELSFTPKIIAVWNAQQRDLKEETESKGEEWADGWVRYIQEGTMLFAVYHNGVWIAQMLKTGSGCTYIANESFDTQNGFFDFPIYTEENCYCYSLDPKGEDHVENMEFNYAIYG